MEFDDPTIYFDIPDPVDLGLTEYEQTQNLTALERAQDATAWVFHRNNPNVSLELRRLALGLVDAGHRHYSIKGLFEVLRFNAALRTTGKPYKLNNNLTPFYARLLMNCEPMLAGFFHTRRSQK
tara:strand:- start:759 stop:1130 length:372 start_codon:yes stop_codon:yes gene_type:complete